MFLRRLSIPTILTVIILFATNCSKTAEGVQSQNNITLNTANNKPVGSSAKDLLTAEKPTLVFEINYMQGYSLEATTLDYVKTFLNNYSNKTSFQLVQREIPRSGKDSLSLTDIDKLERQYRTTFNNTNQVSVYLLITDGIYNPENTLGFAFRNTSIALFGKTIRNYSGGVNQLPKWKLEATTLQHEFGHLFGLVNVGTPMQTAHNDAAHAAHCINKSCLMYYQTETTSYINRFMNTPIPSLDANCHNDLIANGGK